VHPHRGLDFPMPVNGDARCAANGGSNPGVYQTDDLANLARTDCSNPALRKAKAS